MERVDQRLINLIGFAFIAASNGLDIIFKGAGWERVLIYCAPFLVFMIWQWFTSGSKGRAVLYMAIAIAIQLTAHRGNISAAVFAMFAVSDWPKVKFVVPACVTLGVTAFVRFTFLDQTISDFLNVVVLYTFIGVTYYNKYYPKPFQPREHPTLKPLDIKIMQLLVNGASYKQIAAELEFYDLTEGAVGSRVKEMRKKCGVVSTPQLIGILYNLSYIHTDDRNLSNATEIGDSVYND